MTKIAYNACYGGFGLSDEAVELYLTLKDVSFEKAQSRFGGGFEFYVDKQYYSQHDIDRDDIILIKVIEHLGDAASGGFSKLQIRDIPSGTLYRIDEYDGFESVMTVDDYNWSVA